MPIDNFAVFYWGQIPDFLYFFSSALCWLLCSGTEVPRDGKQWLVRIQRSVISF